MTLEELDARLARAPFAPVDRHFARWVGREAGSHPSHVKLALAAALVSQARREGHLCIDLNTIGTALPGGSEFEPESAPLPLPPADEWVAALEAAPRIVGVPGSETSKPLILTSGNRLYLARYWDYEQRVARDFMARAQASLPLTEPARLGSRLKELFPVSANPQPNAAPDWQQVAALAALRKRFVVITGGPGTGKTTTLSKVLTLLLEFESSPRIALAAPTGKAAARMGESLAAAAFDVGRLAKPPGTLHRLLGSRRDSPFFHHDAKNPLRLDALVIDEASMVDVALLAKVLAALPREARLILVGDKDQLASVEAGSVLGDICTAAHPNQFSSAFRSDYSRCLGKDLPGSPTDDARLPDLVVQLVQRHRAGAQSPIYPVSDAIIAGNPSTLWRTIADAKGKVLLRELPPAREAQEVLGGWLRDGFRPLLKAADSATALAHLRDFQVLCAVRKGPWGVEAINRLAETELRAAGLVGRRGSPSHPWYAGRLVMITANDPQLEVFNGDTGITLADSGGDRLHVCLPGSKGEPVRIIAPVRLPSVETAFAITVHKSQGSEFDHVLVILPDKISPLLTRELVYTAVTRARKSVEIWAPKAVLEAAVEAQVQRHSGLAEALR